MKHVEVHSAISPGRLEEDINHSIVVNSDSNLIDIKFSNSEDLNYLYFNAILIYEKVNK